MTTNIMNQHTITMTSNKNRINDIRIYLSARKLPKNEIRPTNGLIMKIIFTIKFRMTSANSQHITRSRSNKLRGVGKRRCDDRAVECDCLENSYVAIHREFKSHSHLKKVTIRGRGKNLKNKGF